MLHPANWIDPRSVDWSDSLNPLTKPGWSPNNNQFAYDSLQDETSLALRNAIGIEARIWVCPDSVNQVIAAQSTTDFNVPCEPNTWIWALNAVSNPGQNPDPAGFYVQVTDSVTGAGLFSSPVLNTNLDGTRASTGTTAKQCPLVLISAPRLNVPPAYPIVRIVNLSNSPQTCIVQLFCAIETDVVTG
jgi:hypothetical protein